MRGSGTDVTPQDSHLQLNHAVEIIGKVQNDLSVRVMASTDFGPEGNIGEFMLWSWVGRQSAGQAMLTS